MGKKKAVQACCVPAENCCKVESIISIDARGQMVLPKEIREKAKIKAGDKLAVFSWVKEGRVCCISLIKTDDFSDMTKGVFGPMMSVLVDKK